MRLRPLALADLDWIEQLEPVLFGLGAWSRQTYVDELRRSDRSYVVAVDSDGTLLGYAGVALDPEWNIMTVGVSRFVSAGSPWVPRRLVPLNNSPANHPR